MTYTLVYWAMNWYGKETVVVMSYLSELMKQSCEMGSHRVNHHTTVQNEEMYRCVERR